MIRTLTFMASEPDPSPGIDPFSRTSKDAVSQALSVCPADSLAALGSSDVISPADQQTRGMIDYYVGLARELLDDFLKTISEKELGVGDAITLDQLQFTLPLAIGQHHTAKTFDHDPGLSRGVHKTRMKALVERTITTLARSKGKDFEKVIDALKLA